MYRAVLSTSLIALGGIRSIPRANWSLEISAKPCAHETPIPPITGPNACFMYSTYAVEASTSRLMLRTHKSLSEIRPEILGKAPCQINAAFSLPNASASIRFNSVSASNGSSSSPTISCAASIAVVIAHNGNAPAPPIKKVEANVPKSCLRAIDLTSGVSPFNALARFAHK